MKAVFTLLLLSVSSLMFGQNSFNIAGKNMGKYSLNMSVEAAEKIADKKITIPTESNNWESETRVNNDGEAVYVYISEEYHDENESPTYVISMLKTKSAKFKTKEQLGIGSTRDQLIDTYRNAPSFSISPDYGEDGTILPNSSIFMVEDHKENVMYTFFLKNNKVVEINISTVAPCC